MAETQKSRRTIMSHKPEVVRKALARLLADKGVELVVEVDKGLQNKEPLVEIERKVKKTLYELEKVVIRVVHR